MSSFITFNCKNSFFNLPDKAIIYKKQRVIILLKDVCAFDNKDKK